MIFSQARDGAHGDLGCTKPYFCSLDLNEYLGFLFILNIQQQNSLNLSAFALFKLFSNNFSFLAVILAFQQLFQLFSSYFSYLAAQTLLSLSAFAGSIALPRCFISFFVASVILVSFLRKILDAYAHTLPRPVSRQQSLLGLSLAMVYLVHVLRARLISDTVRTSVSLNLTYGTWVGTGMVQAWVGQKLVNVTFYKFFGCPIL